MANGSGPQGRFEPDLGVEGEERDPQKEGRQDERRGDEGGEGVEPARTVAGEGKGGAGACQAGKERHDEGDSDAVQEGGDHQRVAERLAVPAQAEPGERQGGG